MKKLMAVLVAVLLVVGIVIGGTMAWLTSSPDPVLNTFTVGDINITLTEDGATDSDNDGSLQQDFKMIPGVDIEKKPVVTVENGSEACWLFVKVEKSSNFDNYLTCSVPTGEGAWTQGTGVIPVNVYYRQVPATTTDEPFNILAGNAAYPNGYVTVNADVTKEMMEKIKNETEAEPTLTFKACAIQQDTLDTAEKAWDAVPADFKS